MGKMFPLHCNKCYGRKKLEPSLEFYVSRCGHIVCGPCLQEICPKCRKPFNGVPINNEMPPSMMDYFDDPLKLLRHFQKVSKFQYDQERSLVEYMTTSHAEAERRAKDAQRTYTKIQQSLQRKLDKENERLLKYKEYIAYHERRLEQSRYMAPPITAQPRLRYPPRKALVNPTVEGSSADFMAKLTQSVKSRFPAPRSPTISTNDDSSMLAGDDISRTPPQFQGYMEHKKTKTCFAFPK